MKKILLLMLLPISVFATELRNTDFMLEIAKGNIPGHSHVNKFGANEDVADGVSEDVWEGSTNGYPWPLDPATAPITHIKQSTDTAADRGAGIEVQGLNIGWTQVTQIVALDASNTTNPVALATPLYRIYRLKVVTNVAIGADVVAYDSSITTNYGMLTTGNNQSLMALYSIPRGFKGYMTQYSYDYVRTAAKDPNSVQYQLWIADRGKNYEFQLKDEKGLPKQTSPSPYPFLPYLIISEMSDIKVTAEPEGADAHVHAGFHIILVEDGF